MAKPVSVFFSYSHKDEGLRDQLADHLRAMEREGLIRTWHDRKITAGTEWRGAVDHYLASADLVLILVSSNFIASDYCYDVELKQAIQRHQEGLAKVIPIILKPVDWRGMSFGSLKSLPRNGQPITTWENQDLAFLEVVQGIREVIMDGYIDTSEMENNETSDPKKANSTFEEIAPDDWFVPQKRSALGRFIHSIFEDK